MRAARIDFKDLREFMLAGNAMFTVASVKTGVRFTYKVEPATGKSQLYWVSVLTGPDNSNDYTYMGVIFITDVGTLRFKCSNKEDACFKPNAKSVIAIEFVVNTLLYTGEDRTDIEFWHVGKCCVCGRKLTTPESVNIGIGPECARKK